MRLCAQQGMKNMGRENIKISDELLAAFLDGNVTAVEAEAVLSAAASDASLMEFFSVASDVSLYAVEGQSPLCSLAAEDPDKLCAVHCERYVLQCFGIRPSMEEILKVVEEDALMEAGGMPLFNVGALCSRYGLKTRKEFCGDFVPMMDALDRGCQVIAAVDVGELDPLRAEVEDVEDRYQGQRPDHCVVVLSIDPDQSEVVCYDPASGEMPVTIPIPDFMDAWQDSDCYMVAVSK